MSGHRRGLTRLKHDAEETFAVLDIWIERGHRYGPLPLALAERRERTCVLARALRQEMRALNVALQSYGEFPTAA